MESFPDYEDVKDGHHFLLFQISKMMTVSMFFVIQFIFLLVFFLSYYRLLYRVLYSIFNIKINFMIL